MSYHQNYPVVKVFIYVTEVTLVKLVTAMTVVTEVTKFTELTIVKEVAILTMKNPAYGRQSISRPMRIVALIPQ